MIYARRCFCFSQNRVCMFTGWCHQLILKGVITGAEKTNGELDVKLPKMIEV